MGLLSSSLVERVRLIVLDFDQTVLRIHSFHERIMPVDVPRRNWRKDFVDADLFVRLVNDAHAVGIAVVIASFGMYVTIQAYLDQLFPQGTPLAFTRDTISTPSVVGSTDGWSVEFGKNKQITRLCSQLSIPASAVLFLDGTLWKVLCASRVVCGSGPCVLFVVCPNIATPCRPARNPLPPSPRPEAHFIL
jgi:hypothetical protein